MVRCLQYYAFNLKIVWCGIEFGAGIWGSLCVAASAVVSVLPFHLPSSRVDRCDFCSGPVSERARHLTLVIRLSFTRFEPCGSVS